jgi:hypothetical protein
MTTERGGVLAWVLTGLLLFLWLRFLVHVDPRFPGSFVGSALGIVAAALMLVPLLYSLAKRVFRMRGARLRSFLTIHIYAGLLGGVVAIVHTGHKFDNPLGILLTAQTLIVVVSGFVGRYLLQHESRELGDKRRDHASAEGALVQARAAVVAQSGGAQAVGGILWRAAILPLAVRDPELRHAARQAVRLVDAVASMESSIALHEHFRHWVRRWLRVHLVLTGVLYLLLGAHVFAVTYYGLRWWPQ